MNITTKELTAEMWNEVEELFGSNGACGGCWCQSWRIKAGEKFDDIKGDTAKKRMRRQIEKEEMTGIIAFDGAKPVGWCNFGPRNSYARINWARTLKCDDADKVWSIPCFFVIKGYRRKGVAGKMLEHAVKAIKKRKGKIAEAYPSKPDKDGKYIDTFAWTGTLSLLSKGGFEAAGSTDTSKVRVRKYL